jgi:hypothetical protein
LTLGRTIEPRPFTPAARRSPRASVVPGDHSLAREVLGVGGTAMTLDAMAITR